MKTILATLMMAVALTSVPVDYADAKRGGRSDNAVTQQRLKLKAEWARSRANGGFQNPLSAFVDLLSGEDTGNAVQPVIGKVRPDSIFDNHSRSKWQRSE
ncbi:MAG: hypothetical protein AAF415_00030 [Pseudomonadota bacterium]